MAKFKVKRPHIGDREYQVGDVREANSQVVAHLVASGVLEAIEDEAVTSKTEPPAKDKAEPSIKNKASE
ncbi:hypothetical protein [Pseudooceanicola nitratireducens]|uniref:hypothetical protein n=1 Tax=Pseudooceanicola nitratireducens TaxID=517719 RepID=UPI0023EFF7CD|nr:hypothetical protein [Pseudooceanicola nitratireducens]